MGVMSLFAVFGNDGDGGSQMYFTLICTGLFGRAIDSIGANSLSGSQCLKFLFVSSTETTRLKLGDAAKRSLRIL